MIYFNYNESGSARLVALNIADQGETEGKNLNDAPRAWAVVKLIQVNGEKKNKFISDIKRQFKATLRNLVLVSLGCTFFSGKIDSNQKFRLKPSKR